MVSEAAVMMKFFINGPVFIYHFAKQSLKHLLGAAVRIQTSWQQSSAAWETQEKERKK